MHAMHALQTNSRTPNRVEIRNRTIVQWNWWRLVLFIVPNVFCRNFYLEFFSVLFSFFFRLQRANVAAIFWMVYYSISFNFFSSFLRVYIILAGAIIYMQSFNRFLSSTHSLFYRPSLDIRNKFMECLDGLLFRIKCMNFNYI